MSRSAHACKACQHPITRLLPPIPSGPAFACAIVWLCPKCRTRNVDLCAPGPDEPKPEHCLECDVPLEPDGRCSECELDHAELVARVHARCGDPPTIAAIRALRDEGLYRLALGAVELRLQADPSDADALVTKAKLLTEVHRPAEAVPILRRVLAGSCPEPTVAIDLGVALANSGQDQAAIEVYERFLVEHPGHEVRAVVLTNIGACYSNLGHVAQGEAYHRRAIAADPERMGSRWNLFANLCKAGRLSDAVVVLEDAAGLACVEADDRDNIHAFRGQLLFQLGRLDEALAAFDESLVGDPTAPDRQFCRARILVCLGRLDQARVALHHVLARRPDADAARELLAKLGARVNKN